MKQPKKLIGEGLQFRVFKISKDRVLKIPTTRKQKIQKLRDWGFMDPAQVSKKLFAAGKILEISLRGLQKIIKKIEPSILGNPTFLQHPRHEQDYILPLGKYLPKHSLAENKIIIDAYADHIIQTWRYGFSDTIFNFTFNNGVKDGKVVLLDLGELTFSKKKMQRLITEKLWLHQWSYTNLNDTRIKAYFTEIMNSKITMKTLEKNWKADMHLPK